MKDNDLLLLMYAILETDSYDFGSFYEFNGLDVKNLKHPFFDK